MYDKTLVEGAKKAKTLPVPSGHQILIALPTMKEKTDGGVFIPTEISDREQIATITGYVLALGPDCYVSTRDKEFPGKPYCKLGDWVMFRTYSGTRFTHSGQRFLFINDDTVQGVVSDPREINRS